MSAQWGETYPSWSVRQCLCACTKILKLLHFLFSFSFLPLHSFLASFPSLLSPLLLFVLFLSFPDSCKLLVETSSISHLTPSLISHCALVHCESSVMTFDVIVDTWLDKAPMQHNLSAMRSVCLFSQTIYKESRLYSQFCSSM